MTFDTTVINIDMTMMSLKDNVMFRSVVETERELREEEANPTF